MQLFKVFYWNAGEPMHRETIQVQFLESETPGGLIRRLMETGLNVEKVVAYTHSEMIRDTTPFVPEKTE